MVSYSHLLKNFPQFVVIHRVKGFGLINKAQVDVFLEFSCFFDLRAYPVLKPTEWFSLVVAQSRLTLSDPMDCSKPGFPVHHQPSELTQNSCPSSWWCHPTISSSVVPFSSFLQSFPASGSFPVIQFFTSGAQIIGASASVLSMNI